MCLITTSKAKRRTLKKDLVVWKTTKAVGDVQMSLFQHFIYEKGKVYRDEIKECYDDVLFGDDKSLETYCKILNFTGSELPLIEFLQNKVADNTLKCYMQGFHFYLTRKRATGRLGRTEIQRFVVPAGSEVIISPCGCGIANAIMWEPKK